jgi:crotonobetainyl-CoA:carnitine CoA-transferase CaiB-like acyl-CoA transferase
VAGLLDGVRVVDLTGESGQLAGRALADLGADVTLVEPPGGSPVRALPPYDAKTGDSLRFLALNAGKRVVEAGAEADRLTAEADIVLAEGPPPGEPTNVWVAITPFGLAGPRKDWRATDLTLVAAGGNLYPTGDPDRAPVACREPTSYAHVAGEAVVAALTALSSGRPQVVDVSIQETMLVVSMTGPPRFPTEGARGKRRGSYTGRTREIWPCADGYVSFGLRGGKARLKNLQLITHLCAEAGVGGADALTERDWSTYDPSKLDEAELERISAPIAEYFAQNTMRDLYQIAVETGLMLAPANSPRELLASDQLAARNFYTAKHGVEKFPGSFVIVNEGALAPDLSERQRPRARSGSDKSRAWDGLVLLEFGSGAAGPIATRYFASHGATVVKIESTTRPDFLRSYGDVRKHGMDGSAFFSVLNAGKRSVTLNMKDPRGVEIAKKLVMRADAVSENFAPKAMASWGMDYASLVKDKPDLVMISACLQGQTGPHKDYPGFGGQGAALSGYNFLTGWPDREPLGPHGTITDSLAPRYVAAALAAGLWHHRQTGQGCYLDLAQVEAALFTLTPWLLDYAVNGNVYGRDGNRSDHMSPHGVFPSADVGDVTDRWVAVACRGDDEWRALADVLGIDDTGLATFEQRKAREDEVEKLVADWTSRHTPSEAAEQLQQAGVTAYEVHDFGDLHGDPQLNEREHFVALEHLRIGRHLYERDGFRLSASDTTGPWEPGPLLGQHNAEVLQQLLDMDQADIDKLAEDGVLA